MVVWGVDFNPISQIEETTMLKTDTGREQDIKELYRQYYSENDTERRGMILETIRTIKNESGLVRSMRESLIKAHRNGDKWAIKDIHDFIARKQRYGERYHF